MAIHSQAEVATFVVAAAFKNSISVSIASGSKRDSWGISLKVQLLGSGDNPFEHL